MKNKTIWVATSILLIYFIFTSGIIYEATGSNITDKLVTPYSFALSGERTGLVGVYTRDDINCAEWLAYKGNKDLLIVGDYNARNLMRGYGTKVIELNPFTLGQKKFNHCYIFLRAWNLEHGVYIASIGLGEGLRETENLSSIDTSLWQEVFRSGSSAVYIRNIEE